LGALAELDCELALLELALLEQPASAVSVAIVMRASPGVTTASRLRPCTGRRACRGMRLVRRPRGESVFMSL